MKKYQIQNSIGSGNFSTVFKGVLVPDGTPCAIKILKTHHNIAVREAQLLKKFKHPNIISIIDFEQTPNQSRLILQYMGINTLQLYQSYSQSHCLKQQQVKCILFQAALGLHCVHSHKIIHRDIKPQNILIDRKLAMVKLIDFGLAIDACQVSTDYIATRWYRAPENLLPTKEYTCAIDVFSLACVVVELFVGAPLFPGKDNLDQVVKIFNVLGYPTPQTWVKGYEKMLELGIKPSQNYSGTSLKSIINNCDSRLLEILQKMLQINPKNRITCEEILRHSYFKNVKSIVPPSVYRRYEQDILMSKSLNFKGFQPAKSSKNNINDVGLRQNQQQKINFHHVSAKTRQQQPVRPVVVERSPANRQQKSSSVDSYQFNQHLPENFNQLSQNYSEIRVVHNGVQNLSRKLSTPTLPSFLKIPEHPNQSVINQNSKSKSYVEMISEDNEPQMTVSTRFPDSSQPPTSQKSRNYMATTHNLQTNYKLQRIPLKSPPQNKAYPFAKNVPIIPQPISFNPSTISTRIVSPQNSFRQHRQQTINSSSAHYIHEQLRSPMQIQLKSVNMEGFRPPLQNSQNGNYPSFKSYDSSRSLLDKGLSKDNSKQIRNLLELRSNVPQFLPRENHTSLTHNMPNFNQISQKQQITYRNSQDLMNGKPIFMSPAHRMHVGASPDAFNTGRQKRMHAVNSPIQYFLSPQPRKY